MRSYYIITLFLSKNYFIYYISSFYVQLYI
jgi:hypothetical protein